MSKVSIRPLGEKVLVKRLDAEEKTAGGIVQIGRAHV
jgi:co-chaperonin GroES (HSP10)